MLRRFKMKVWPSLLVFVGVSSCGTIEQNSSAKLVDAKDLTKVFSEHRLFHSKEVEYAKLDNQIPRYEKLGIKLPKLFGELPPTNIWWAENSTGRFPERYYWNFWFEPDVVLSKDLQQGLNCKIEKGEEQISSCQPQSNYVLHLEVWAAYRPTTGFSGPNTNYNYKKIDY